jgi:hypothetical protein
MKATGRWGNEGEEEILQTFKCDFVTAIHCTSVSPFCTPLAPRPPPWHSEVSNVL